MRSNGNYWQRSTDGVDDTYEEWRKNANSAFSEIQASGKKVRKVLIKISKLQEWCSEKGLEPNSKARAEYASTLANREYGA